MIQLSEEARAKLAKGVGYYVQTLDITLTDGTVLNLTNENILGDTGVEIEDATSGNDNFEVGSAIINQCRFTLVNFSGEYDNVDFYDARVQVWIGIPLDDDEPETVSKGVFYIVDQTISDTAVTLTGYDAMQKFDKPYTLSNLTYPVTLAQIVADACTVCGVTNLALNFPNKDYVVASKTTDEKVTFREIIAWCAQMACCFARINNSGALTFGWYNTDILFDDDAEAGIDYHDVTGVFSRTASASDIEITGIKIVVSGESSDETYSIGTEGYVLELSGNRFITGSNVNTFLDFLGQRLIGLHFRKLDVTHLSDPSFEAGDIFRVKTGDSGAGFVVDTYPFYVNDAHLFLSKRGYYYCGLVTYTKFTAGGNQNSKCSAEDKAINQSTRYNSITKLAESTKRQWFVEKTAREQAVQQLEYELANSPGLYVTAEVQPDQSTIYYAHDKAELEDSTIIWKMTSEAIGISTDGGQTYPYGLDVSGDAILNRIYVIGIDAQYVNIGNKSVEETLHDDYYTQTETNTQITAGINGFSSVVAQTYTTKAAFEGLEIGGTNLIRNTADYRDAAYWSSEAELLDSGEEGVKIFSFFPYSTALQWRAFSYRPYIQYSNVRANKVTLSYWYRSDNWQSVSGGYDFPIVSFQLYSALDTTTRKRWRGIYGDIPAPTTTWQKYVGTFTVNDAFFTGGTDAITGNEYFSISIFSYNNSNLQIKKLKLEMGDKATTWSPSPEDNTGDKMVSMINQTAQGTAITGEHIDLTGKTLNFTADNINITSTNFSVTSAGVITATSGKIGGWDIGASSLYHTMTSLTDTTTNGVYIGLDGIGFGKATSWIKADGSFRFGAIQSVASTGTNDDAWVTNALHISYGIELYAGNDNSEPYIDFRRDRTGPSLNDTYDYTARISNSSDNCVSFYGKKTKTATTADPCTVTAYAFSQGSDRRLKNRISLLNTDKARAFISALKPSSFYYNGVEEVHHGFIYDDVESEKYNRDWVVSKMAQNLFGDGVPYGTVSILEIVPDMVAVMQELIADNESLKAQIAALRSA